MIRSTLNLPFCTTLPGRWARSKGSCVVPALIPRREGKVIHQSSVGRRLSPWEPVVLMTTLPTSRQWLKLDILLRSMFVDFFLAWPQDLKREKPLLLNQTHSEIVMLRLWFGVSVRFFILIVSFFSLALWVLMKLRRRALYAHIPGPPSRTSMGYLLDMHAEDSLTYHYTMSDKYGHVARLRGGMMGLQRDGLYITDPLALHSILVRDQNIFRESVEFSGLFGVIHHGDGLASVWGPEHKKQRKLMNPVFTASHVSKLTPLFYRIANQLRDKLASEVGASPTPRTIDVLDYLTRTALELISQGGLGHTFNSFDKYSQEFHEFHEALKTVLPMAGRLFIVLPYLESWRKLEPFWLRRFLSGIVAYLPWPSARMFKWGVDTMHPICAQVFDEKKKLFNHGGVEDLKNTPSGGKDLTTQLMQANSEADEEDRMPDDIVIANISSIVLGGQETTSGALTRLLCLMVTDTSLQSRLREEIKQARIAKGNDDEFDYNELNGLSLLDAVCREALRLFAPVTFVWRQTMEDCVIPLKFPLHDSDTGTEKDELLITKGTPVYVGLAAANRSTAIWGPDANVFKPERWLGKSTLESTENNVKMPGIFSNVMTFLGGGRACPGMKFALLEIKLVLSVLLSHFSFEAVPEEIDWRLGITVSPYVKGREKEGPSAPMKVKKI